MPLTDYHIDRGADIKPRYKFKPLSTFDPPPVVHKIVPMRPVSSFDDEEDDRSFFQRYRVAMGVIAVAMVVVVVTIKLVAGANSSPRRESSLVLVALPPPPPPPPVQPAPPEPKMVDQQTFEPEEKPQEEPPKPPDQPPIGTNIKGDGSENAFGLGNSSGSGFGNRGEAGSRFGWYAGQVQSKIGEALRNNRKTRNAEMTVRARIWSDATGRITRAELAGSTSDASLDATIKDEVLTGLQLREPPPAGMPMPIVLRLTAKRPN